MTQSNRYSNPRPVTLPQPPFDLPPVPVEMTRAMPVAAISRRVEDDPKLFEEDGS